MDERQVKNLTSGKLDTTEWKNWIQKKTFDSSIEGMRTEVMEVKQELSKFRREISSKLTGDDLQKILINKADKQELTTQLHSIQSREEEHISQVMAQIGEVQEHLQQLQHE